MVLGTKRIIFGIATAIFLTLFVKWFRRTDFSVLDPTKNHRIEIIGRFQPVGQNSAVDTVTVRLCWTYDPIGHGSPMIPLCSDLYSGKADPSKMRNVPDSK